MSLNNFFVLSLLTENSGHLLLDDLFWVKNLINKQKRVTILTSSKSAKNILTQIQENPYINISFFRDSDWLKKINYRLFLLYRVYRSSNIKNSCIIIQGFEELSILLFLFKIRKNGNKIILIHTNNISPERLGRSKIILPFLLKQIFLKCDLS